jgi:basic membrane lipoprotein Med (substrate-binding protein (PBP1-ABC) superfamily)
VGDFGWTYAHNEGRKWADNAFKNVDSSYIESVPEAEAAGAIETLVNQGADLVITTSFGYMDQTAEVAAKHPDRYFVHISGYRSGAAGNAPQNMSSAFAEFYQLYYLNGLAAGAVTQTGVVGYVAAHPIPEVVRHINAFVLGANYAYKKRTGKTSRHMLTGCSAGLTQERQGRQPQRLSKSLRLMCSLSPRTRLRPCRWPRSTQPRRVGGCGASAITGTCHSTGPTLILRGR